MQPIRNYLIIGQGIAGTFIAHQLLYHKQSVQVMDAELRNASQVSSGIYNPVILKRFTPLWQAGVHLEELHKQLDAIEHLLAKSYRNNQLIYRILHDENEKKTWIKKSRNPRLSTYIEPVFHTLSHLHNPYQSSVVHRSGRVYIQQLLKDFKHYLEKNNWYTIGDIDYQALQYHAGKWQYQSNIYDGVIFCEGYQNTQNPYFNYLPIIANKGELLHIAAAIPHTDKILKKRAFIMHEGLDTHLVGASYDASDTSIQNTPEKIQLLKQDIAEIWPHHYEIIGSRFGFRPTTPDRRPIIGEHPTYKNLYIFNGLGAHGLMHAPAMAKQLVHHLLFGTAIDRDCHIGRFTYGD